MSAAEAMTEAEAAGFDVEAFKAAAAEQASYGGTVLFLGSPKAPEEITDDNEDEAWTYSIAMFIGDARFVDLYFELSTPALMVPRFFRWYVEFSPTRKADDWYRQTTQHPRADGTIEERAAVHEIAELAPEDVAEVLDEKDLPPTLVRRHVRLEVRARFVRVALRSYGSRVKITGFAGA